MIKMSPYLFTIPAIVLCASCGGPETEDPSSSTGSALSSQPSVVSSTPVSSSSAFQSSSSSVDLGQIEPYAGNVCNDRITYSARKLRLLTRNEIQNSLEDLLGINFDIRSDLPADIRIHGYENNTATVVTELHADSYLSVAERVAAWSAEQNFAGVIDCSGRSAEQCAERFSADFLPRAFRRPISDKERARIAYLFSPALIDGDLRLGIELALTSVFTSPNFLYRSEMGTAVSMGEYDGSQYDAVNIDNATNTTAADFGRKDNGILEDDGGWTLRSITSQTSLIEQHFSLPTGGTLMTLEIRGEPRGGVYPELLVQVPGHTFTGRIENESYEPLKIYFPDTSGHHPIHIRLNNAPSQDGDGARITLRNITLSEGRLQDNAADEDAFKLSAFEVAAFLSYTFSGSTPDQELLNAAQAGRLETEEGLYEQAYRLLGTPRGKAQLGVFAEQWLGVDNLDTLAKDPAKYPELTAPIRAAMAEEFRQFFAHVVVNPNSGFSDFFSADYTFANKLLADYYGIAHSGSGFEKVSADNRGGVLTTGAFLATYGNPDETSPIRRAVSIREHLLCQTVPPPPPGVVIGRDEAVEELGDAWINGEITNRARYDSLTQTDYCATCHKSLINPLGFGLENFDTIGLPRDFDLNELPIDASGQLIGVNTTNDGQSLSFYGAKGLSTMLAEVHSTKSCMVQNAFRYVMGHGHTIVDKLNPQLGSLDEDELADYACTINDLTAQLAETNDLRTLFANLGALKLIRHRKEKGR